MWEPRVLRDSKLGRTNGLQADQAHRTLGAFTVPSLTVAKVRVRNFRNIDDTDWIPIDRVTALVGRNESGKSAFLRALHKFNPATPAPYEAQKEFPRDRYTREFKDGKDWPVCEVQFKPSDEFAAQATAISGAGAGLNIIIATRYYDGSLRLAYDPEVVEPVVSPNQISVAVKTFEQAMRRESVTPGSEEATLAADLLGWATEAQAKLKPHKNLRDPKGVETLEALHKGLAAKVAPKFAEEIEKLVATLAEAVENAQRPPLRPQLDELVKKSLPVFIYFENYGILDSAIYLPQFLAQLKSQPNDSKVRTINAMFSHVTLTAQEISDLGREEVQEASRANVPVTGDMIARDRERKELRAIKLNSASIDITRRFSAWYHQRRHKIRYDVDGPYFRIWISDDRRPDVEIELEERSKGFQWFFSFYLVFLVESQEGHKEAVLLLDEPGLDLHPTAQQELIQFFETLSETNQLIYTTHSPFLIDGEHLQRVRPVVEDESGHSRISTGDTWPSDRETIFPLQAAAGYAMVRGLFQRKKNVLVEGMADYLYLYTLSAACRETGRESLPDEIYITPCGGTKNVGYIASLFMGHQVRPVVILDADDAGRARQNSLLKDLYSGNADSIMMLSEVLGLPECEIEDIFGESIILPILSSIVGASVQLTPTDRLEGSLADQIESATKRENIELRDGWKAEVARRIAIEWTLANAQSLPGDVLDRAESLFRAINERFERQDS